MEKRDIITHVTELPLSMLGEIQEDTEIWEGCDDGATFKVTRHMLPGLPETITALSVSGELSSRTRLLNDFVKTFGEPTAYDREPVQDTVIWHETTTPVRRDAFGRAISL